MSEPDMPPNIEWTEPPLRPAVSQLAGRVQHVTATAWLGCQRRSVTRIVRLTRHDAFTPDELRRIRKATLS